MKNPLFRKIEIIVDHEDQDSYYSYHKSLKSDDDDAIKTFMRRNPIYIGNSSKVSLTKESFKIQEKHYMHALVRYNFIKSDTNEF